MQGVRHDGWIGAREQSEEKTCGRANILVDLCNSRGKPFGLCSGEIRERAGVSGLAVARHENGHEVVSFLPLAVSYHLCIISLAQPPQGKD
jgi:hypothetical protein